VLRRTGGFFTESQSCKRKRPFDIVEGPFASGLSWLPGRDSNPRPIG
jgi:hypothetical protein